MTARKLYEASFQDLVSVIPPGAELAETSSVTPEARGKVPGKRRIDGQWVGYPFTRSDPPTEQDIVEWERSGANVGLRARHYPGLDVDVDHPQLAAFVVQEAQRVLGPAPVRTSREPRKLLVYRTEEPFTRIAAMLNFTGDEHTVEMLGVGRQYLVAGEHPSGTEYGWEGKPLWEHRPDSLTVVTKQDVHGFFDHLATRLRGRAEVEVEGTGDQKDTSAPPQEELKAPSLEALTEVVAGIPNRFPDRDSYIQVGHAIKAAGGEEAFEVFADWADRWEQGTNEPETVEADWSRMHPPFRVGWEYLQDLAASMSDYVPAQEVFEADQEMPNPKPSEVDLAGNSLSGLINYTDTWVVERVADRLQSEVRFVPEASQFHVWDGSAWAPDRRNLAEHLVRRRLIRLSEEIREKAAACPDEDTRKKMYKFSHALQQRHALTKVVPELQAHPSITLTVEDFDGDDWKLNTPEGIVDLRSGEMRPSDPSELMSKTTAVAPSSEEPTRWFQFLEEATGGDEELKLYLQRLAGYALTGSTQEQTLGFIHGPPATGKTVFIDALAGVFGSYHENAAADTFASARGDRHPADLAKLAGARLVTAAETQEGRAWDTQRIKVLTGGDRVSARFMRQDFFTYTPSYQILIVSNHEPEVNGVDDALMRRLHIIPFEERPDEMDRLLSEKLKEEWPGILQWAIEGCLTWLEQGLDPPKIVLQRTAEYRREEDPVALFLEECCETGDPEDEIARLDLYHAWRRWCNEQGEDPGSLKQLRRRFKPKETLYGFTDTRVKDGTKHRRGYQGIRLVAEEEAFTV